MLIALEGEELVQAGHTAEDAFIRQMKRRRVALGISQAELAEKVVELGGSMYQQTIAKLESGQRALRLSEADVISAALGTSVQDMLVASVFPGAESNMGKPLSLQELQVNAAAVERRLIEAAQNAQSAAEMAASAQAELEAVKHQALAARAHYEQARAVHAELAREYTHLERLIGEAKAAGQEVDDRQSMSGLADLRALGDLLRMTREGAGVTLEKMALRTGIRIPIIRAMEEGDFEACGKDVYARGHIRAYSKALNLEPGPLVDHFDEAREAVASAEDSQEEPRGPRRFTGRKRGD